MARMDDGHQTLISFADDPTVLFYEKTVTMPGIDAGGGIDTTVMANTTWRTMAPKALKSLTDGAITVAYDIDAVAEIITLCGSNNLITITFPDGATLAFWGFLDKFNPSELAEGVQPTAEIVIVPTNQDNTPAETAPVFTPAV